MAELYTFTQRSDNGVPIKFWRYTNAPRAVVFENETYVSKPISAGDWTREMRDGMATVTIPADLQPFPIYIAGDPGKALWLTVLLAAEVTSAVATKTTPLFIGKVLNATFVASKRIMKINVAAASDLRSSDFPLRNFDPSCDWPLFGRGCELSSDLFRKIIPASSIAVSDGGLVLTSTAFETTAQGATAPDDWWTHGRLDRGIESRGIVGSSGDEIQLLSRFFQADDESFVLYPGCNKSLEHCRDKFANLVRFSGYRFVPSVNPSTDGFQRR